MHAVDQDSALPVRHVGDPVLHRACAPVTVFDADLAKLVQDMFASMYAARGVGLAANQIGVACGCSSTTAPTTVKSPARASW